MTIQYFEQIKSAQAINEHGKCATLDKSILPVKSSRFIALSVSDNHGLKSYCFSEQGIYGIETFNFTENEIKACFFEHKAINNGDRIQALKDTQGFINMVNNSPLSIPIAKGDTLICIDTFAKNFCLDSDPKQTFKINTMFIGDYNASVIDPDEFKVLES